MIAADKEQMADDDLLLLSPGPTNIPDRVLHAMMLPSMHHRSDEFAVYLDRLIANMQAIFQTAQPVLPLHATGRGAMEATVTNLLCRDDEIIAVCNGRFGAMYADIAARYGIVVHRVCEDWERDIDLDALRQALEAHPRTKAVTVIHCETSTAIENDVAAVARLSREYGKLVFVDCIASLGGIPFHFDAWDVDVAITASQKALMAPTGLSFVVLSDRAWKATETADFPKAYMSLPAVRKSIEGKRTETPGSTPVQTVAAVAESTTMILEEGLEAVWARHTRLATGVRATLEALGLGPFPTIAAKRASTLSCAWMPEGHGPAEVNGIVQRRFRIVGKAGLLGYKDRVLRIGHMGHFGNRDALVFAAAYDVAFHALGFSDRVGIGLQAMSAWLED